MKTEQRNADQRGPQDAGGTKPYRRHLGGCTRIAVLKGIVRGGALVGIVGGCAVLATREEKFECESRCGRCPKFNDGICSLGRR